jgi:serine/threonine protein kinase
LQLPPHILKVYHQSDPKKTELIAKQVREGSNELEILKYLQTIWSQSVNVISFIETIPSSTGAYLILPKLHSINDRGIMDSIGVSRRVQLGWGLIKGLTFLHKHKVAHRDIKPDNLVRDYAFCLKIIDFDVAIQVQDENTEIDKYCGTKGWTKGWTAPEIGSQDGPTVIYSPIKADRWSCGRVVLWMVGEEDSCLSKLASQLVANNPQKRPSLLEWHEGSAAPHSYCLSGL